jgi:type I restriction enzyme, S subunit
MNAPKLQFKGFVDTWEPKKLSELITYIKGFAFKSEDYQKEGFRIIRVSDLLAESINENNERIFIDKRKSNDYEKYRIIPGDIIVTTVGSKPELTNSAVGRTIYYSSLDIDFLNQNLIKLSSNNNFNSYFIYQNTKTKRYMNHIENIQRGNANQSNITVKELLEYTIFAPTINEQNKLADFFRILDNKIQLQQEKIDLLKVQKKGYMQKIFNREIKFKDMDGREYPEWSKQKLGNLSERITRKNSDLVTTRPLTISAQHGLIDQVEFFNKTVASENLTGYYLLNKGEFAYNKSYSNGYPLGAIKRLDDYENGALSTLYICFTPKDNVNSDFLVHYFDSTQWYKEVSLICVEGARNHGLLNVSVSEFFDTLHYLPCLEEQLKIAKFLNCINQKIKLNEQTLKYLQEQKQAFMQQMFI